MRFSIWLRSLVGLLVFFGSVSAAPGMGTWQTVAKAEVKLLWKTLAVTRLSVVPTATPPGDGDILNPGYAKQIEIEYGLGVSAERFRSMTRKALDTTYPESLLATHREVLEQFGAWYLPVEKGDRYRLSWLPEQGLTLFLNDIRLGQVENAQAAQLILSVWLGPAAVDEDLRDEVLKDWRLATQGD
jgi:hypothetical protein